MAWRCSVRHFLGNHMARFVMRWALPSLLVASLALPACATSSPALREWDVETDGFTECNDADADRCVVLACEEGECGFFSCEDVDPEAIGRAPLEHGAELVRYRPPVRAPGPHRSWRRAGLRDDAQPLMTFHFRYRHGFLPAFPRLEGKLVRHHLFPQEGKLAEWFKAQGINIHAWTMLLPEQVHLRIHRGAQGGPWNEAWRQFREAHEGRRVSQEVLLRKAFELSLRFDIAGPIMPYYGPIAPPGPQLRNP
jgi:uncharacterized lipoprotein (TIGR02269 family)